MGKTRVYVGNLPSNIRERDIEDIFRKYGKIGNLDLRTNKGPPFAFLDFDDSRDAEDAIHGRDGYEYDGYKIRVEHPRSYRDGDRRGGGGSGRYGDRRGGGDRDRRGYGGGAGGGGGRRDNGGIRRSKYRIVVSGLPVSGSWQDLKDHLREAGDVCFADVTKDGFGVAEFLREEDMKYAVKKLDDTKFRSHEGETAYIRIKVDDGASSGGGSGSRRRSRSPSRSRSGSESGDRERKRSRSPVSRPARGGSPTDNGNGKDRGSAKRERSGSRSPSRSIHSKSRSPNKSGGSRSPSRERD